MKTLHGYDSPYDTTEAKDSDWNLITGIDNNVKSAKIFFGDHNPPLTSLHHLKKAKALIEKFIEKYEN